VEHLSEASRQRATGQADARQYHPICATAGHHENRDYGVLRHYRKYHIVVLGSPLFRGKQTIAHFPFEI
jgi:hypothetical protein